MEQDTFDLVDLAFPVDFPLFVFAKRELILNSDDNLNGRMVARSLGVQSRDYQIFSDG